MDSYSWVNTKNEKGDLLESYKYWKQNLQTDGITENKSDANLFNFFESIRKLYDCKNRIYNKYNEYNEYKIIPTSFYKSDIQLIDVENAYVKDTYVNLYDFIEIETKLIFSIIKIYGNNIEKVENNVIEDFLDDKEILKYDERLTKLGFIGKDIFNEILNVVNQEDIAHETTSKKIHDIINPIVLKMYETYIPLMFIYEEKNGKTYENYYILNESILDNKIQKKEIDEINISYVHMDDLIKQFINKLLFDISQLGENYITQFYEKRDNGDIKILSNNQPFNFYEMARKIIDGESPIIELPIQIDDNQEGGIKMKRFKKKHVNKKKKQSIKKKRTKKQNKKTIKNKKKQKQQKKKIKKKKTLKKK